MSSPDAELFRLPASEIANRIRNGDLSVENYAQSLVSRFQARDSAVMAWAHIDVESILSQARELDLIPVENRGPLHGMAIGVKDTMLTKDMPTRYNSAIHERDVSFRDASTVAILRGSGALIMGKTSATEFSATANGPNTRNPHNPLHSPGGSSSGSAAAVADMQIAIGLGTQTGGSIVRPASYNGVYGYKPTYGRISPEGQKSYAPSLDTFGLFSREVKDLKLVADVFGIQSSNDNTPITSVAGQKIGVIKTSLWEETGPTTRAAISRAREILTEAGAIVEDVKLPDEFKHLTSSSMIIAKKEASITFLREYLVHRNLITPELAGLVEDGRAFSEDEYRQALDAVAALRPIFDSIANQYFAIIAPSSFDVAPEGYWTGDMTVNIMWTALHCPVMNIPGFGNADGLPVGVSCVVARGRDGYLLDICSFLGEMFRSRGGWSSSL